ncbi:MAG: hypothetical protein KatS3mg130_2035 [Candidatus Sumerlaea sp.]|jgi:hypothetical protein|uniref:Inner membrane protein n=1 Tax=Sumerlaea chitinivorans TaxID=2250252 RepID=A0A2Z4Y5I5_SUMC1|nr:Putative inner membrane protein [Candidatus Sumerlaea chitinivorans]GIX45627.1 MAG: hypothetical protein KatS3mg130_2035 [Candidatus Sumerlaea sp.]
MHDYARWVKLAFVFFLAAAVRSWNFRHGEPPSFEEIVASLAVLQPVGRYLRMLQIDLCPPVYYLVLKPVSWVSTKLWVLRLVSLFAGAATPALLYWLYRRVVGESIAWWAAILLTLNPLHIFYSQEAQPLALAGLASVLAFYFLLGTCLQAESWKYWVGFNVSAIALLHLHREAAFVLAAFLLVHLLRTNLYSVEPESRRVRWKRLRLIGLNYVLVVVLSIPWLAIMPTKAEWYEPKPDWRELFLVWLRDGFWGLSVKDGGVPVLVTLTLFLVLMPPIFKVLRRGAFAQRAALLLTVLVPLLPFAWSYIGRTRFTLPQTAALALPFYALTLSVLFSWCKPVVRLILVVITVGSLSFGLVRQGIQRDKTDYLAFAKSLEAVAPPGAPIVFWPDFTSQIGDYFFGSTYQIVPASDFFEKWAVIPDDQDIYFALFQFPWKSAHLYTFIGALRYYADADVLWREKLNFAVRAQRLNMLSLRLWYDGPESLNVVDQPTSQTQFIFLPNDPVFRNDQFYWDLKNLSYELDGRRVVWMRGAQALLRLPVALQPGSYVLRVHCGVTFECPDTAQSADREVSVQIRLGEEQKQVAIRNETVVELPFTSESELTSLNVILMVEDTLKLKCVVPLELGLKIYSIAIDQVGGPESL